MHYKFVADASVDVPKEFMEKYDIEIVPIEVRFGDEIFPEGMETKEFYRRLRAGEMAKTSMPNAYRFEEVFKKVVNKPDVFVITTLISMEMSATKLQAQMAAENLGMKNVFIEETQVTTGAHGALICDMCRYIDAHPNAVPEEVIREFYRLRKKIRLVAIVGDLKYLRASGRISSTSAVIGNILNIHPIISLVDGKVVNIAKIVGTAKAEMFIKNQLKNMDTSLPIYTASSDADALVDGLVERCKDAFGKDQPLIRCEIGYVVGTHAGPNCYGFAFYEKD